MVVENRSRCITELAGDKYQLALLQLDRGRAVLSLVSTKIQSCERDLPRETLSHATAQIQEKLDRASSLLVEAVDDARVAHPPKPAPA